MEKENWTAAFFYPLNSNFSFCLIILENFTYGICFLKADQSKATSVTIKIKKLTQERKM